MITDGETNMEKYSKDLSEKKAKALRELTDVPDWFQPVIDQAQKENVIWTHCFCHDQKLEVMERNSVNVDSYFRMILLRITNVLNLPRLLIF